MTSSDVAQLTDPIANHGEGPVWHPGWGGLRFLDMLAGDVLHLHEDGTVSRTPVGGIVAAIRPCTDGRVIIASERGISLLDDAFNTQLRLPDLWSEQGIRMNEGGCDPDGRFYCGSMAYDQTQGAGALYRVEHDMSVATVLTGVTISNGLAFSPAGEHAYYIDSPSQRIDVFDYHQSTGFTSRRTLTSIPADAGMPDGLTVDAHGHLWVALWQGGAVRRYTPDGRLDAVVRLPVSQVTACTFGGPGLNTLFITTSRFGLDPAAAGLAGAVFAAEVGVNGLPSATFSPAASR